MFTGIIRHVGLLRAARATGRGRRFAVDLGPLAEGLSLGDSVAVAGVCLTVAHLPPSGGRASRAGATAEFDVVAETLRRTTLGSLRPGAKVNLERSLRMGDPIDGHLVLGHVDGLAAVRAVRRGRSAHVVEFAAAQELTDMMAPKGSVAVDGVSLTLVEVGSGTFSVALAPTTLAQTTLACLAVGDKVNVEADVIGKYVRRHLLAGGKAGPLVGELAPGGLTLEKLRNAGFL